MHTTMIPGVFRTDIEHPYGGDVSTCGFFVCQPKNNTFFYSHSAMHRCATFIRERGGLAKICLTHRDEFSPECVRLSEEFECKIVMHAAEVKFLCTKFTKFQTFSQVSKIFKNLIGIPTPGHSEGSACYSLKHDEYRILFTGDTLFQRHGIWSVAIHNGRQQEMINSLETIATPDHDFWCPGIGIGDIQIVRISRQDQVTAIRECVERLRNGETH